MGLTLSLATGVLLADVLLWDVLLGDVLLWDVLLWNVLLWDLRLTVGVLTPSSRPAARGGAVPTVLIALRTGAATAARRDLDGCHP
ncbi:MAG TPA: hypothetical protein VG184_13300 [Acidimicrobiales bacterium]|nr:hypothetical protein [Acidimicrobiales bacterium]